MSSFIEVSERAHKQELVDRFLVETPFQLTESDWEAVFASRGFVGMAYGYKSCQLFCCGLRASGRIDPGPQMYIRRLPEKNVCAEYVPILMAHLDFRLGINDPLVTLATFHGAHDIHGKKDGEPYLITPCDGCHRRAEQVAPQCMVTVCLDREGNLVSWDKGKVVKIPLDAVKYFPHPRKHNGEGKH
jgi:hypothetical protein